MRKDEKLNAIEKKNMRDDREDENLKYDVFIWRLFLPLKILERALRGSDIVLRYNRLTMQGSEKNWKMTRRKYYRSLVARIQNKYGNKI